MAGTAEALRDYVHFLHDRGGVRQVRLSRIARVGLEKIVASVSGQSSEAQGSTVAVGGSFSRETEVSNQSRPPIEMGNAGEISSVAPTVPSGGPIAVRLNLELKKVATTIEPLIEVSGSTKAEQLRHLGERASVCVKCPHLAARRHTVVFGVGSPDAKVMFVGEGPGEDEDMQGEPFVGRAGQLLTKMILAMGLTREQVYIANILKCRPDMPPGVPGNRKPTRQEMETCLPYLRAQIEVIKPGVLVALGATAVEGLIGPAGSMGSLRGKFLEYRGTPLMPTYHPSYLLRNQSNTEKRKVWEDLLKVMERVEMPVTDKQRGFFLAK